MGTKADARKKSGTRERILEVSSRLFAERGYSATSVRDIAAELGIANPSLYYHFESKEQLLLELLAEPLARVQAAVAEAEQLSGDARTRRIIAGLLEALEVHSGIAVTAAREQAQIAADQRQLPLAMATQDRGTARGWGRGRQTGIARDDGHRGGRRGCCGDAAQCGRRRSVCEGAARAS